MTQLRLALAQVNPTVGDLAGNAEIVVERMHEASAGGAHLVAFPEMMLTGYPVEDLALRPTFQRASWQTVVALAQRLAAEGLGELPCVVGFLDSRRDAAGLVSERGDLDRLGRPRGEPRNAAAVLHRGVLAASYAKHHLPNYGVFDEARYFVPGSARTLVRVRGVDVALAICEDLWQDGGPVAEVRAAGAGLLLVINGSPYERNKDDVRRELCARRAAEAGCVLAYVNLVGGQDELVFDGDSLVVAQTGELLARAAQFEQTVLLVDLELPPSHDDDGVVVLSADPPPAFDGVAGSVAERLDDDAEVYGALVMGLGDYVRKNGFGSVVLGLSGGIDSALVAAIAVDALGADHVYGVSLPSRYSSEHSKGDAVELARRTGLHLRTVPIAPMVESYLAAVPLTGLAEENLQARVRGTTLMAISNQEGHLVLATGNKSELAVGYSTIYGDAVGGFAPIKDLPKTAVWALSRWRNQQAERDGQTPPIPPNSIDKAPSAELRPGQLDTDSLPDYPTLDALLDDYVEKDQGAAQLVAGGHDPALVERVLTLTDRAEYKRRQYPPGTKISARNFGRDRRLPITSRWHEPSA